MDVVKMSLSQSKPLAFEAPFKIIADILDFFPGKLSSTFYVNFLPIRLFF